jgi:hypothetical protein
MQSPKRSPTAWQLAWRRVILPWESLPCALRISAIAQRIESSSPMDQAAAEQVGLQNTNLVLSCNVLACSVFVALPKFPSARFVSHPVRFTRLNKL